jgi:hypothetical protein
MSYDPTLGFVPLSPPPRISQSKNTATRLHPAKSTPNLRRVCTLLGSPVAHTAVVDDNTTSRHPSHPFLTVPSISVTSPKHSNINSIDSSSLGHPAVERYPQTAFRCDSKYIPAIAMSPHHSTGSQELPIWKLQLLGPFGVEYCSGETQLSIGSLIRLFDAELARYTFGFERHILSGCLVKALWREPGIQVYLMKVDRFTVTTAPIAVEQATVYVAIPNHFVATSDLIAKISSCSLGQEIGLGGQAIFPARKWTHPLKAEIDRWHQQRAEKREGVEYMQEGH